MSGARRRRNEQPPELSPDPTPYRLIREGPRSLSDAELLAVLLHSSCRDSAIEVATGLLDRAGGLAGLFGSGDALLDWPRVGKVRAATVLAVREIASRLWRAELQGRKVLDRPGATASYLLLRYGEADQEVVGALGLDPQNRLLAEKVIFRGGWSRASAEPRQVLRAALRHHASGIVLFHTHPSGDPRPSARDIRFTGRLRLACRQVGIELVDHLIVGCFGNWVSLRACGEM